MTSTRACYYILALLAILFSCKNSDPGPASDLDKLLVVAKPPFDSSSKYNGLLISLNLANGGMTKVSDIKGVPAAISKLDDKLLVLAKDNYFLNYHWLNRIDLLNDSLEKTTVFSPLEFYDPPARINVYNNKLYIPGINSYELVDILNIVNTETMLTEDTLHMPPGEYLTDVVLVGDRLFAKLNDKIRVYNNTTLEYIATIPLQAKGWVGMVVDKNNQILIPEGQIQSINPGDLSIVTTSAKVDVYDHALGVQPALDKEGNVLYFMGKEGNTNALKRIDLTTGEVTMLCSGHEFFFPDSPSFIRYDKLRHMLMVGGRDSNGRLTTLSTGGTLIEDYLLVAEPLDVVLE